MSLKYHINPATGRPNLCRAKIKCDFDKGPEEHFDTKAEAKMYVEKHYNREKSDDLLTGKKKKETTNVVEKDNKEVQYSFLKDFKELEEKFDEEYDGIPNRFYNYDLYGKGNIYMRFGSDKDPKNIDYLVSDDVRIAQDKLLARMYQAASSPKDMNVPESVLMDNLEAVGIDRDKVFPITDERVINAFGATKAWIYREELENGLIKQTIISNNKKGTTLGSYRLRFRSNDENVSGGSLMNVDVRTIMGAARVEKLTGESTLKETLNTNNHSWRGQDTDYKKKVVSTMLKLAEKQESGADFKTRQKYIKEANSKVATVWQDKKNQKETHLKAAKETTLRSSFSDVEIDNDVDLAQFESFERDFNEVKDKLPAIPKGREPRLAIRKLGKHSSSNFTVKGLYSPGHNAIAISVNDSGSTIHEMAHMYDFTAKGNASVKEEFTSIRQDYSKNLKIPDNLRGKDEYYSSSHEVFARGFEVYAHKKLGINNRLLNPEKFEKFDYEPIVKNPELETKLFNYFDTLFKDNK